jgi:hypothetical protein
VVDVFISYPRRSRARVEPIKAKLDALGLDCFYDLEGIDGGAEFPAVIDRAVKAAKSVLGCWSPDAFTRPWVMQECRVAHARNVLVPVAIERFDNLAVPTEFFGINYLDLVAWDGSDTHEGWQRTLVNLSRLVDRELTTTTLRRGTEPKPSGSYSTSQSRVEILSDLRTTWATFPAKNNPAAVAAFLSRVRGIAPGSGLEFEAEFHLEELQRSEGEQRRAAAEARERDESASAVVGTWRGELHFPEQIFARKWTLSADGLFQSEDYELGFVEHGTWEHDRGEITISFKWGTIYRGRVSGQLFRGKIHTASTGGSFSMHRALASKVEVY